VFSAGGLVSPASAFGFFWVPGGVAINPTGTFAYVFSAPVHAGDPAAPGTISKINLATNTVNAKI